MGGRSARKCLNITDFLVFWNGEWALGYVYAQVFYRSTTREATRKFNFW